jgi:hypothetical protein
MTSTTPAQRTVLNELSWELSTVPRPYIRSNYIDLLLATEYPVQPTTCTSVMVEHVFWLLSWSRSCLWYLNLNPSGYAIFVQVTAKNHINPCHSTLILLWIGFYEVDALLDILGQIRNTLHSKIVRENASNRGRVDLRLPVASPRAGTPCRYRGSSQLHCARAQLGRRRSRTPCPGTMGFLQR